MKKITRRLLAFLITVVMAVNCAIGVMATETDVSQLGKLADTYATQSGSYTLNATSRFFIVSDTEPTGDLLQTVQLVQRQFAADGLPTSQALMSVWGPVDRAKTGDIIVNLDTSSGIAAEGYSLNVSKTATVTASDVDGLLYGLNMLQKFFRAAGSTTLPGFTASDAPDTAERTVMLDCGRKYYTKNYICNFIREISWMGYNTIELHFSEDGGFRMDFWDPDYYKGDFNPVYDFSWICGSLPQSWVLDPYDEDPDQNKYLTTAEIVEILETAKEYHLDVIPSFDSPAHTDYLNWKFEQNYKSNSSYSFKYNGTTYKASSVKGCINYTDVTGYTSVAQWPYYSTINIKSDLAKAFIFQLYSDIADFFKEYAGSTKFNIGADEVNLSYSSTWSYSDFPGYVNELDNLLNAKGYTVRAFNDFIGSTKSGYTTSLSNFNSDIEILYWNSPYHTYSGKYEYDSDNMVQPLSYFVDEGRTVYNVIQTNVYYCTRITGSDWTWASKDARDPDNRQWQIYHSNEENIYNEWYPADISEHGDYSEDIADVTGSQLGGAYFCIWHDFASMNTESEIWNGAVDKNDSSKTYYLLDRMWSNTIKMWNWDINDSVSFSTYEDIRDNFGYFPGYSACSVTTSLPAATTPTQAYAADHSALTAALANKISQDGYSAESYAAYEAVYEAAQVVNADYGATAEELAAQVEALKAAEEALKLAEVTITVTCKTNVNGTEKVVRTITTQTTSASYEVYLEPLTGYTFSSISGATYVPLASGDGSGYIQGTRKNVNITVWYENTPVTSRVQNLLSYEITEQGNYSDASWSEYQEALATAKNLVLTASTTQADVDQIVVALENAQTKLAVSTVATDIAEIISIEKLTATARVGKQIGLKIITSPDVTAVNVVDKELTLCVGKVQSLSSGETVKIWLINFAADAAGSYTYTVNATSTNGTVSGTVDVTVK